MSGNALVLLIILLCVACTGGILDSHRSSGPGSQQSQNPTKSSQAGDGRSPLIEALYQASRQEHNKDSSRYLDQAKDLLAQNANVNVKDAQGRTALHWTVIGAMYAREEKVLKAYLELADQIISRGADVNAEDIYGNAPLDFQQVSPNDGILYLLLDHGARNGASKDETTRLNQVIQDLSAATKSGDLSKVRKEFASELQAGTQINIRLTRNMSSHGSRSGDPVEAVVIAPVVNGDRVMIGPGIKVEGTILLAMKAYDDYRRAQLILDFAHLVHHSGVKTLVSTSLEDVDNAKETVQAGRIIGLPHPNDSKFTWGARLVSFSNPVLSYAIQAAIFARDKEFKREINYDPGVEMTLTVLAPVKLAEAGGGQAWPTISPTTQLIELVRAQPMQTTTSHKIPSDISNLMFIGTREKIEAAFEAAGWVEPEKLGPTSGLMTFLAVAESKGFKNAPVSLLLLDGQKPDFAFQKQNDTFAKRHHIRIWKRPQSYQGREVWVAAATHDIGIAVHRDGTQWIHRIDSKIDRERAKVTNDLLFTGFIKGYALIDRPGAPRESMNATGDKLETDGKMTVLVLN